MELIMVQFWVYQVVIIVSGQNFFGSSAFASIIHASSLMVLLRLSAIPFCCRVRAADVWRLIPCSELYASMNELRNSIPLSEHICIKVRPFSTVSCLLWKLSKRINYNESVFPLVHSDWRDWSEEIHVKGLYNMCWGCSLDAFKRLLGLFASVTRFTFYLLVEDLVKNPS